MSITEEEVRQGAAYHGIPEPMVGGLVHYFVNHIETGSFLMAVISDSLTDAVGRADENNLRHLINYARFLYWVAPGGSWGSEAAIKKWLASGPVHP